MILGNPFHSRYSKQQLTPSNSPRAENQGQSNMFHITSQLFMKRGAAVPALLQGKSPHILGNTELILSHKLHCAPGSFQQVPPPGLYITMLSNPSCRWVSPFSAVPVLSHSLLLTVSQNSSHSFTAWLHPSSLLLLHTGGSAIQLHLAHSSSFTASNEGVSVTATPGPVQNHTLGSTHRLICAALPNSKMYFPALFAVAFTERQEGAGKLVPAGCQIYSFLHRRRNRNISPATWMLSKHTQCIFWGGIKMATAAFCSLTGLACSLRSSLDFGPSLWVSPPADLP